MSSLHVLGGSVQAAKSFGRKAQKSVRCSLELHCGSDGEVLILAE